MGKINDRAYLSEMVYVNILLSGRKQYELADMIGVSPSAFNKALHGHPISKSDARWKMLASIINISPRQLFG